MSADNASEVSGPVATITGWDVVDSGIAATSSRTIVMSGCDGDRQGDRLGELLAIDGERRAGRHAALLRNPQDQRAEPPHFFLEETDCVIELVAAEGVAAHELGEPVGLVNRGRANRPHLVERHRNAARSCLPRGLAACQAAADDSYGHAYAGVASNSSLRT